MSRFVANAVRLCPPNLPANERPSVRHCPPNPSAKPMNWFRYSKAKPYVGTAAIALLVIVLVFRVPAIRKAIVGELCECPQTESIHAP